MVNNVRTNIKCYVVFSGRRNNIIDGVPGYNKFDIVRVYVHTPRGVNCVDCECGIVNLFEKVAVNGFDREEAY